MRAFLLCVLGVSACGTPLPAQENPVADPVTSSRWTLAGSAFRSLVASGNVSVREQVYTGTPLDLQKDLGMRPWSAFSLEGRYRWKERSALALSAEYFLFAGSATVDKGIWFNGVHMTGANGLTSKNTGLLRLQLTYARTVHPERRIHPTFGAGLVADFLDFYVEGTILPDTWGYEQHERFARQTLPYPFLSAELVVRTSAGGFVSANVSGTYIPEFKSFFDEGGPMWLQYGTFNAGLEYGQRFDRTTLLFGMQGRRLRIWQESPEDANDVLFRALGVRLRIERSF